MKIHLALLTVLVISSSTALASGSRTTHDWSGSYIGAHVGYGSATSRYTNDYDERLKFKPDGFLAGLYAGNNYQFDNNVVIGVDADFSVANLKDNKGKFYDAGVLDPSLNATFKMRWTGAARVKVGYAMDRFLPYVAGGVSYGNYEMKAWDNEGSMKTSESRLGWNIGAGFDYAFTDSWVARLEYRYSDYGKAKVFKDVGGASKLSTHEVRLGLAYQF